MAVNSEDVEVPLQYIHQLGQHPTTVAGAAKINAPQRIG